MMPEEFNPHALSREQIEVKQAVADARTLGGLYVLLGCLGGFGMLMSRRPQMAGVIGIGSGVLLIGPGVLYFIAAAQLSRMHARGGQLAILAACAQLLAIVVGFVAANWIDLDEARVLGVMAVINVFFVPALVVFLLKVRRASRIAKQLDAPGHSFQVLPAIPVTKIEDADSGPSPSGRG